MTDSEQINAFQQDLEKLITRYTREFNLSLASAVGVLEIVKLDLVAGQKAAPVECAHFWGNGGHMQICLRCGAERPT